ncbi:MAG: adenylyltransferase/cytidyltransferase family protein [Actinomycetota bacterium]|nr:adenylyltransferase/cytidyltransferase family protein [Actinomycetota bacterium]
MDQRDNGGPGNRDRTAAVRLSCVTGRFQPVHHQHVELFARALEAGDVLLVAVTNPDPGGRRHEPHSAHRHEPAANPFTYLERLRMLAATLAGMGATARAAIVPFDLTRPEHWHHYVPLEATQFVGVSGDWEQEKVRRLSAAGYRVVSVAREPAGRMSAAAVREAIAAGGHWQDLVPAAAVPVLEVALAERPWPARTGR